MKPITLVKREGVFIPIKDITPEISNRIKEKLSFKFYEEKVCKTCEWLAERHCDVCDTCPAFKSGYELATVHKIKDNKYLKIPVGSHQQIVDLLELKGYEVTIKDKSPSRPIRTIKFTGIFKEGQAKAVEEMKRRRRGFLRAPPRSGKTVSGSAAICDLSRKTLIIAGQREWLNGFIETFIGSRRQPKLTDIDPKRIKLCKTFEDFRDHDICLCTPNIFYSEKGQSILVQIRDFFEVLFIDEVHQGAADKYIQILAKFNVRWMIGLSATPSRKDNKFLLVRHVVGPKIHEVIVPRLQPQVKLNFTDYKKDYKGNVLWTRMVSSLENDPKRINQIAKQAVADIKAGHLVMIPYLQVKPVLKTIEEINKIAGEQLAYPYHGQVPKKVLDKTLEDASFYKVKCLVGTVKKLSVGLNIPRASMLYEVSMSSNKENAEQRMMRVLTAYDGKPQPVIRYFLDDMNVRRNCLRNEYFNVLKPKLNPIINDRDQILLDAYFKQKSGKNDSKFEL
jgi:superfamily II DNA or RNA helicase